jgi:hypothetical protein
MAPFLQFLFRAWQLVRSSLEFGLFGRRTWPLALMVSTNQVPFGPNAPNLSCVSGAHRHM